MVKVQKIVLDTKGNCDIIDITKNVRKICESQEIKDGMVNIFCAGSTCGVTTIEYERGLISDLKKAFSRIFPEDIDYEHDRAWADGNGFSHIRSAFLKTSLTVPLISGKLILGTWQQIVFIDFDIRPRRREIIVQIIGE